MNLAFNASRLIGAKVLIIGDVMLDHYQSGIVERISPEAPVPVVKITDQEFKIGGAGNVAQNIALLGGLPTLISLCGNDLYGDTLEKICHDLRIDTHLFHSPDRETTLKTRIMAAHQQMLRVDRETERDLEADETRQLRSHIEQVLDNHNVIVLSDYGKGIISEDFLAWFLERARGKKIILDPKTCNFPHYRELFCMTPNTKEASEGIDMPIKTREDVIAAGRKIVEKHDLESLVITMGAQGMSVFLPGDGVYHLPTMAKNVFDVTGAGDTVIGVIAQGLSAGLDLLNSCILANCAAGLVVGQVGAVGITQEELLVALEAWTTLHQEKWCSLS